MSNKRVMAVDDDEFILETVDLVLSEEGYDLTLASSGEECLRELERGFKGLILLDIMMPGMDGWDTVEDIVKQGYHNNVLVCMLTAIADPSRRSQELSQYVIDYMVKPFAADELKERVANHLAFLQEDVAS